MVKRVLIALVAILIISSCASATAKKDTATYLESVDENGSYAYIKIVDKETGCKYLAVVESQGGRSTSLTQMRDKNDKPLCK
jgi:uncharacterized protein YceK